MKKLFTNDKFFLATVLCTVICEGVFCLRGIVVNFAKFTTYMPLFVRLLCVIFMYSAYRKHSKNVMKGLVGAMLMAYLLDEINMLTRMSTTLSKICISLSAALAVLLFINHFIINSDHHSSPAMVRFNQIIAVLLAVDGIIWTASTFSAIAADPVKLVSTILNLIGFIGYTAAIVCVESRLDAYRLDREAAGWTEEKGYPENYVHEYEKK